MRTEKYFKKTEPSHYEKLRKILNDAHNLELSPYINIYCTGQIHRQIHRNENKQFYQILKMYYNTTDNYRNKLIKQLTKKMAHELRAQPIRSPVEHDVSSK